MSRQPIRWNRDALESLREAALGVLILIILPLSTIVIAATVSGVQ